MSKDEIDKTDNNTQTQPKQKQRGWFRRNWRRFVLLLLVIIVVGGGAAYWALFLRVYNLDVCRRAMQTIAADKGMQETLGLPIKNVLWPSQETVPNARIEKDEIDVIWTIEGPKKQARAHLLAKRRQGRWDTVMLEVTPDGGKRVSVHEADNGEDAPPPFQGANPEPPKTGVKKPESKSPDINIDLPVPPGDAPSGGK
jgi:hypothetical protein